ncbi:MAG: CRTAC1 family protein [Bacteroidia bacterium]|nr:CRTAC1 family protein [Bacteroidia bacterium]
MKKGFVVIFLLLLKIHAFSVGEASTYFEIFVPPNNDAVRRDVSLIITALYDSTTFTITDDGKDGDTDDSVTGMLMSGQSYVLYIRDNSVNDDANQPGQSGAKQDGDFFIVHSNNLVFASQSTNSDWQHDWVPATNKTSLGNKFIVFSPPTSYSPRDLNVFAYQDSTEITIREISTVYTTTTGYTQVDARQNKIVAQRTIHIGQDIINYHTEGRDIMKSGGTYIVESNKPVTLQYGALHVNARDGGGYVPSGNGTSSGELFYFSVPYQADKEQEIRIVSWHDNNAVTLDYFDNGTWKNITSWTLNELSPADWVSYTGNISKVFRVKCSPGKKVSVFEANWLETGSPGTSDIASMVSSRDGTTAGDAFLIYLAPPGNEHNVRNPKTGTKYNTQATHAYIFSRDTAHITVVDAKTKGQVINRSYTITPGDYVDCFFTLSEWKSIYNGTGTASAGPDRPYILITADRAISVFNTNFNDNWMAYFGTSQTQDFGVIGLPDKESSVPGDSISIVNTIILPGSDSLKNTEIEIVIGDGATVTESNLVNHTDETSTEGSIDKNPTTGETKITFENIQDLDPKNTYTTETEIILDGNFANGDLIPNNTVVSVETIVSGEVNGNFQQAATSVGVKNETQNHVNPLFYRVQNGSDIVSDSADNLSISFGDYNNDGFQDVFMGGFNSGQPNLLYKNNGDKSFTKITTGDIVTDLGSSVGGTWGDYDNDGDLDIFVANVGSKNKLYTNNGNATFTKETKGEEVSYTGHCYSASWVDADNDGYLDLFVADYISNRRNLLYKNNGEGSFKTSGEGTFTKLDESKIFPEPSYSLGATWCDYDNDGDMDLFVPNGNNEDNSLYRNEGNFSFTTITEGDIVNDGGSSVGSSWGDYDNDGDMDLYVTNINNQANFFYNNNGDGTFTRITDGAIANDRAESQGSFWGDVNNDGYLDLYLTNAEDPHRFLYLNNGDGSFSRNTTEPLITLPDVSLGTATADIDNDGDLDVIVANHLNAPNYLFTNNSTSNHWFEVKLVGTTSNRSAIGAKVRIKINLKGEETWLMREISGQSGGGAASQNSLVAHFGLGDANTVDSIQVEWPSGFHQFETDVAADQLYVIEETSGTLITGKVFFDADSSCTVSPGEAGIPNQLIHVMPGDFYAVTDTGGNYSLNLHNGVYTIEQAPNSAWAQICPAVPSTYEVEILPGGGTPVYTYTSASQITDCSAGCTRTITNNNSDITVNSGQRVCIAAGVNFTRKITINGNGVIVICGNATPNQLKVNNNGGAQIIVSSTGKLTMSQLQIEASQTVFINYSNNMAVGSVSIKGIFENHGTMNISGFDMDNNGKVLNTGTLNVSSNVDNKGIFDNYGTLAISGKMDNTENGTFTNSCKTTITGDFIQKGDFIHKGYLQSGGKTEFTESGTNTFTKNSKIKTVNLILKSTLTGPNRPGVSIEVSNNTELETGSLLTGYVDICDQTGIEKMYASLGTFSSINCSVVIDGEPCNDGSGSNVYTDYDFANAGLCNYPDLAVTIGTSALRRGFENDFVITLKNKGSVAATNAVLEVEMNNFLDARRTSLDWTDSIPGNQFATYRWVFANIPPLSTQTILLTDSVKPETVFGSFITTTASLFASVADCDSLDNTASSTDEVVGSYDPNDKQVWPKGYGDKHYILSKDTLSYKIRFQNVGNYLAGRVVIYDTLSPDLELSSFIPGSMSHDGFVVMGESGILKWTFNNINLPDSGANEPESHGFVLFKISPKTDLPHGAVIRNSAAIQFDYNELIYTNQVFNTINNRNSYEDDYLLELTAFPNPVTDRSVIMTQSLEEGLLPIPLKELEILNAAGMRVRYWTGLNQIEVPVLRSEFLPGVYVMKGWDHEGNSYIGRMIVN